ncbi:S4 domain protein [Peptoniphilus sp. oral taxon 375 str. F0436]|uniref:RNA-binding S4 domain-containing protein n=1 Tax=Urinicoccus timonensis TaxID=2024205 RepID=UPI00021A2297|nr:RNA-binding S4 domain-containing protein [Urinicoccus timonensis]EGS30659.1 S4 domain protein [Peptoniphilus sp. oral taxon 375 str. F0436]
MEKIIELKDDFIRLDQALKLGDLVQSGGHAKLLIQEGQVMVNGEVEYRRGKKLLAGDRVFLEGQELLIK